MESKAFIHSHHQRQKLWGHFSKTGGRAGPKHCSLEALWYSWVQPAPSFHLRQAICRDQLLIWHLSRCISFTVKGESTQFVSFHGQPTRKQQLASLYVPGNNSAVIISIILLEEQPYLKYFETQKLVGLCIYL